MKIIDKANTTVEFSVLKVGQCFLYDNCLFIKMNPVKPNDNAANAFCFIDNAIAHFRPEYAVTPVEADITIHSKGVLD
jgi:hypothetical protein